MPSSNMVASVVPCFALLLAFLSPEAIADQLDEPILYKCSGARISIWAQSASNEDEANKPFFDDETEGKYDINLLMRQSGPEGAIRKQCSTRTQGTFEVSISPSYKCQDGAVPEVMIRWNGHLIFRAQAFGSNCQNVRAPFFVEADATNQRLSIGFADAPKGSQGQPYRFTIAFPLEPRRPAQ